MRRRSGALWCLLALVFAGDAFWLHQSTYRVTSGDLNTMVRAQAAPALGSDASRAAALTTTTLAFPLTPETTTPPGPADPPPPPEPPPLPLRPPRLDVDFPDPSVVWGDDRWYAFSTNSGPRNVPVSTSSDLFNWTAPVDAVPTLPSWSTPGYTWAPAVAKIGNRWVMYVSIIRASGDHCIDRLVAAAAGGPYAPVDGGPLVCDQTGGNGAIDPSVFTVGDVPYLYWKADGATTQQLFGVALTGDGMAFAGEPQHLLTATAAWQRSGIENPSMVAGADADWLVYSGAYWATGRYAMGYARCSGPLGPCTEMSASGPWVATSGNAVGPGGGSLFSGPDGALRLAFHAWEGGTGYSSGGRRLMHIENIDVRASGPSILDKAPNGAVLPLVIGPERVSVRGSAIDPDTNGAVDIEVFVDGEKRATALAHPSFGADLAVPADGPHRVCVVALDDLRQSRPQLGCQDFTISSVPFGALEAVSPTVAGWAIAPWTTDSIAVDIYVDGRYVTSAPADGARHDVAAAWPAYGAAHGFSTTVPVQGSGPHRICAYAVAPDNQPAPELGCITT